VKNRWSINPRTRLRGFLLFLAVMGPGLITALVDNDAGGIATYSLAGAHYGYALLWTLLPTMAALIVVQEMCARMGVVTGKGLADLIREQFGVRITFAVMLLLVIANLGNILAEFAGIAASVEIFRLPLGLHISRYVSVPIAAFVVWRLVVKGTARVVEKVFMAACLVYLAYPISGFLAHPDWGHVLARSVVPEFHWNAGYIGMLVGVVGTTIAPWMQFYQQSAVVEKGIRADQYHASRLDTVIGMVFSVVVAFFITVACAATLFQNHIRIQDAAGAAQALAPLAGQYASVLFAIGLFNASLFAASILPLSTAYSVCEGLGFESGVNKRFREAPVFYWLYTGLIVLGAGVVLLPAFPMVKMILFSQVVNGALLPVVLVFMIKLVNNTDLMHEWTNSRFYNAVAWVAVAVLIAMTVVLIGTSAYEMYVPGP
jgi:NRAMP (natural resistance-associated macrophage protein)-like metal ion transporter